MLENCLLSEWMIIVVLQNDFNMNGANYVLITMKP